MQNFLVHFWQGMPSHMLEVLGSNEVVDLIGQCDTILYKAISGVLIPGTLQPLPARYEFAIIRKKNDIRLLNFSLHHFPMINWISTRMAHYKNSPTAPIKDANITNNLWISRAISSQWPPRPFSSSPQWFRALFHHHHTDFALFRRHHTITFKTSGFVLLV